MVTCDVLLGTDSPLADAEVITVAAAVLKTLEFKGF